MAVLKQTVFCLVLLSVLYGCSYPTKSISVENTVWQQSSGFGALTLFLEPNRKARLNVFSDHAPHLYEREGSYVLKGSDLSVTFPKTALLSKSLKIGSFKIPSQKVKLEKLQANFKIHGFFESGSKKYLDGYAKLQFIGN